MPRAASAAPLGGDPGEAVRLGPPHRRRDCGRRPRRLARPAARPRYSPWSAWRPPSPTASAFTSDDPASAWPVFLGARVDAVGQRLHGRAAAPRPARRRAARPPPTRTSRLTEADATGVVSGASQAAGSVPRVAFVTEPVMVTGPVRLLTDRLVLPVRGRKHGVDLGVGHRLALDPHLVALPGLRLGHHLGDQVPAQPHLTRLAPTGASATRWPSWRLVHERPAHPLADGEPVLPGGFNRLGLGGAGVRPSAQAGTPRLRSRGPGLGVDPGVRQPPGRGAGRLGEADRARPRLVVAFWLACLASRCAAVQRHGVVVEPVVAVQLRLLGLRQLAVRLDVGGLLDLQPPVGHLELLAHLPCVGERHERRAHAEQAGPYHRPLGPAGLVVQVDVDDLADLVAIAIDHDPAQPTTGRFDVGGRHVGFLPRRLLQPGAASPCAACDRRVVASSLPPRTSTSTATAGAPGWPRPGGPSPGAGRRPAWPARRAARGGTRPVLLGPSADRPPLG